MQDLLGLAGQNALVVGDRGVRREGEATDAVGLDLAHRLRGGGEILVDDGDVHTDLREERRDGSTGATARADDEGVLAGQPE